MLLEKLVEYADILNAPPIMYEKRAIKYLFELDSDGKYLGLITLSDESSRGNRGKEYIAPTVPRSSNIRPILLMDTGEYALGIPKSEDRAERVEQYHQSFKELINQCAVDTDDKDIRAIADFLSNLEIESLELPNDFDPSMNVTFSVDGDLPFKREDIQEYWRQYNSSAEADTNEFECISCGKIGKVEERLTKKVKGLPGGQSSGTSLISANENAYFSYGLEHSLISPICRVCAEKFTYSLNTLLREENNHIRIGPIAYVFWMPNEKEIDIRSLLENPEPADVKALFETVYGRHAGSTGLDLQPFYAASLSASGSRVVIRDIISTTLTSIQENLTNFFSAQTLQHGRYFGIYSLASGMVRTVNVRGKNAIIQQLEPHHIQPLLKCALQQKPIPRWMLQKVSQRIKAEIGEETFWYADIRASLIKLILTTNNHPLFKEGNMEELNPSVERAAYHCGRLLSVLEEIQEAAIPGVKSTIVDRFFGTASTAPASVFGRLVKGSQSHLGKLRKEKPGYHVNLQRKLADVMGAIHAFPRTLSLEDQGLFALGYYHQRADRYAKHEEEPAVEE